MAPWSWLVAQSSWIGLKEGRKDQLLDTGLLTYLVTHLTDCLDCPLAKHDFTCSLEHNDLEK